MRELIQRIFVIVLLSIFLCLTLIFYGIQEFQCGAGVENLRNHIVVDQLQAAAPDNPTENPTSTDQLADPVPTEQIVDFGMGELNSIISGKNRAKRSFRKKYGGLDYYSDNYYSPHEESWYGNYNYDLPNQLGPEYDNQYDVPFDMTQRAPKPQSNPKNTAKSSKKTPKKLSDSAEERKQMIAKLNPKPPLDLPIVKPEMEKLKHEPSALLIDTREKSFHFHVPIISNELPEKDLSMDELMALAKKYKDPLTINPVIYKAASTGHILSEKELDLDDPVDTVRQARASPSSEAYNMIPITLEENEEEVMGMSRKVIRVTPTEEALQELVGDKDDLQGIFAFQQIFAPTTQATTTSTSTTSSPPTTTKITTGTTTSQTQTNSQSTTTSKSKRRSRRGLIRWMKKMFGKDTTTSSTTPSSLSPEPSTTTTSTAKPGFFKRMKNKLFGKPTTTEAPTESTTLTPTTSMDDYIDDMKSEIYMLKKKYKNQEKVLHTILAKIQSTTPLTTAKPSATKTPKMKKPTVIVVHYPPQNSNSDSSEEYHDLLPNKNPLLKRSKRGIGKWFKKVFGIGQKTTTTIPTTTTRKPTTTSSPSLSSSEEERKWRKQDDKRKHKKQPGKEIVLYPISPPSSSGNGEDSEVDFLLPLALRRSTWLSAHPQYRKNPKYVEPEMEKHKGENERQ